MTTENGQSIVHRPWEFACQWYGDAEIEQSIQRHLSLLYDGTDRMPRDVASPEFAKWLANQYRHAMRKGAELAVAEMRNNTDAAACPNCGEPSQMFTADLDWCSKCHRQWPAGPGR